MTAGSGENIKPVLAVNSEGRIWLAWQRNRLSSPRRVEAEGYYYSVHTKWDIYARYYDGKMWSSEMLAMDCGARDIFFDIVAGEEGDLWVGWTALNFGRGSESGMIGARRYWDGEWNSVGLDTLDYFGVGPLKLFFRKNSLRMVIWSLRQHPVICNFNTRTCGYLGNHNWADWEWCRPPLSFLSRISDEKIWLVFDIISDFPCSGCIDLFPTACFLSDPRWTFRRIDRGAYTGDYGPLFSYASVKSVGSDAEDRIYVTCAVDKDPVSKVDYSGDPNAFAVHYLDIHLEVWCFDATTGDTLSHWNLGDAQPSVTLFTPSDRIEVATTDEAEIVGFAVSRNGDMSLRALMDPVWYTPVSLEEDSTVTSAHPSAVVDHIGNIWVAWDDGKDIYVSSVNISEMEVDETLASVESDAEDRTATPAKFLLAPNYPNPFNASTSIVFAIPFDTPGELSVYDLLGRKLRTLMRGDLKSGEHRVVWDGRDDSGHDVSSGIYLYRLMVDKGRWTETRKLALVR